MFDFLLETASLGLRNAPCILLACSGECSLCVSKCIVALLDGTHLSGSWLKCLMD